MFTRTSYRRSANGLVELVLRAENPSQRDPTQIITEVFYVKEFWKTRLGTTYAELMPLFEADPETHAIAIYSEPGGRMEAELAEWVREHDSRLPIVAFMAGRFMDEMKGMRFGHAGTIVEGKEDTTAEKIARMEAAGISVAERIEEIPELIRKRLGEAS